MQLPASAGRRDLTRVTEADRVMRRTPFLMALAVLALAADAVMAQEGAGLTFKSGAIELKFGGRIQVQAGTSTCDDFPVADDSKCAEQVPTSDLFLRRVRLSVEAKINDRIDLKIEPDYNKVEEVGLKDAWGRFTFSNLVRLKAGHFKRPFDEFTLVSSSQILTIERPIAIRGLEELLVPSLGAATAAFDLADRDIGVELSGSTKEELFSYWVGVFTGNSDLKFQDTNAEKQFIGRAQLKLDMAGMPFKLIGAAAATDAGYETEQAGLQSRYYYDFEIYAELGDFGGGPHVQAGVVLGDNPLQNRAGEAIDLPAGDSFAEFWSWQAIGSWKIPVGDGDLALEPLFRITYGDPNSSLADDGAWGFTPGLQIFFYRRNRLALNWDIASYEEDGLRSENSFKAQIQFQF